jgi:hypothetical protein
MPENGLFSGVFGIHGARHSAHGLQTTGNPQNSCFRMTGPGKICTGYVASLDVPGAMDELPVR